MHMVIAEQPSKADQNCRNDCSAPRVDSGLRRNDERKGGAVRFSRGRHKRPIRTVATIAMHRAWIPACAGMTSFESGAAATGIPR